MSGKSKMTAATLIELLQGVPIDTPINILNSRGELTANIEFHFEDLETRKFVELIGHEPFWKKSGGEQE
ncbi:hypothetical protein ABEX47_03270 [Paenibacillus ehimensis]|uniref:hypothetical protein n=1 Tax=Paenibacillus ehimensis TaxID=79264 RepID=UPI003D286076